jgi:hypothetical protein
MNLCVRIDQTELKQRLCFAWMEVLIYSYRGTLNERREMIDSVYFNKLKDKKNSLYRR